MYLNFHVVYVLRNTWIFTRDLKKYVQVVANFHVVYVLRNTWNELLHRLAFVQLLHEVDELHWNLTNVKFTMDSLYKALIQPLQPVFNI
jgi:hypothetical protein